ncbi:Histone-lysine N-methyltransferase SETMAR [Habropoda laboriosa]|uniref:Histone-lysine N-methyltransferase SETMAR n=1 Tax=Habropoda laboriosa TaxID=597456 RepID=A0A0L7QT83_9HYME|nr:Histone-lysine N-methyltransferase SETMAR [Habropoda laboriosa]
MSQVLITSNIKISSYFREIKTFIQICRYWARLEKLKEAIAGLLNWNKVIFYHDNARPHVAQNVQEKSPEFGGESLSYPSYSLDIAPSDYCLFRALQRFDNIDSIGNNTEKYFNEKPKKFYNDGIMALLKRWEEVVEREDNYILP